MSASPTRKVEVTLTIVLSMEVHRLTSDNDVFSAVEHSANRYVDGRHFFASEMLRSGAAQVVSESLWDVASRTVSRLASRYPALDPVESSDAWARRERLEQRFLPSLARNGSHIRDVLVTVEDYSCSLDRLEDEQ